MEIERWVSKRIVVTAEDRLELERIGRSRRAERRMVERRLFWLRRTVCRRGRPRSANLTGGWHAGRDGHIARRASLRASTEVLVRKRVTSSKRRLLAVLGGELVLFLVLRKGPGLSLRRRRGRSSSCSYALSGIRRALRLAAWISELRPSGSPLLTRV